MNTDQSMLDRLVVLSAEEIRREMPDQQLRIWQIIHVALVLGTLTFLGVNLVLEHLAGGALPDSERLSDQLRILAMALVPLGLTCYLGVALLPTLLLSPKVLAGRAARVSANANPVSWAVQQLFAARIITLTLLEAPALIGLVTLMLGIIERHLPGHQELWFTLVPLAIQVLATLALFPSRERLAELVEQNVIAPLRRS